jgi:hypothetical protein
MPRNDSIRPRDMTAGLMWAGSLLFAFSALSSAFYAIYYALGEAFPDVGLATPTFVVVTLIVTAMVGVVALGVGLTMSMVSGRAETRPIPTEDEAETPRAA